MQNSGKEAKGFFAKHTLAITMWILLTIIGVLLFSDFFREPKIMTDAIEPYALSTKGKTFIVRDKQLLTIGENQSGSIQKGDKIKTLDSTTSIYWPDGSVTRLGEQSAIKIHTIETKTANEGIKIDFSLEQGKSWSNIVKYMFGESYFHERFNNDTSLAAVRGTVFEVNLDRKYIHTIDHAVSIQDIGNNTGSTFIVAGGVFDTDTRKALAQDKIDELWNKANTHADIIYLNERLETFNKALLSAVGQKNYLQILLQKIGLSQNILPLEALITGDPIKWEQFETVMKTGHNSEKLLDIYQQFYGQKNSQTLLDTKIKLRDLIIETAPIDKKQNFLTDFARSTLYDSWNTENIAPEGLEQLKTKLGDYLQQGADKKLIDDLQRANENKHLKNLNNTIESLKTKAIETLGKTNLLDEIKKEVNIENIEKVNEAADNISNSVVDGLKNIIQ